MLEEIQVDFLGSDVDLKIVLIWFLLSHIGFSNRVSIIHFKGTNYLYIHFLKQLHFF